MMVAQTEAQKGETQATKNLATIDAPYDCVVVDRMVDLGNVVRDARRNSGAKSLYRVSLGLGFPIADLARLNLGRS